MAYTCHWGGGLGCAGGEEVVVLDGANATKVVGDTTILQRERASIQSSNLPLRRVCLLAVIGGKCQKK